MANTNVNVYNAAMAMFEADKTVSPSQMVSTLGPVSMAQAPASKHVWALKKLGFDIQPVKNGREVVGYTLISAPIQAPTGKPVKAAATKAPKAAATPKQPKTPAAAAPVAARKKSPTKATKFGPANKTGRSEIISEGTEFSEMNELDDRSDLNDVLSTIRSSSVE